MEVLHLFIQMYAYLNILSALPYPIKQEKKQTKIPRSFDTVFYYLIKSRWEWERGGEKKNMLEAV